MGASTFSVSLNAKTEKQLKIVFHQEAERDREQYGHDCYSGTIGQKNGYILVRKHPVTEDELAEIMSQDWGDKWGDALACPVAEEKKVGRKKTRTRVVVAQSSSEAKRIFVDKWGEGKTVTVKSITQTRAPVYKLVKKDSPTGWRVTWGFSQVFFGTKAECTDVYKNLLLKGERARMFQQAQEYVRVLKTSAKYEVTAELITMKPTGKISHYEVWGTAAE